MAKPINGAAMPRRFIHEPDQLELGTTVAKSVWFNELRAFEIFSEIARRYRGGIGFYHGVRQIQPQHLYTPDALKKESGRKLANFFFYLAMSQRGGLNSDDSIRVTNALWRTHQELFDPGVAALFSADEITSRIQGVAERFYRNGLNGDRERRAGSLSFKLFEFALHRQLNSAVLAKFWEGDIRNVFTEWSTFEGYFQSISRGSKWEPAGASSLSEGGGPGVGIPADKNQRGFYGMRRKIFTLLCFWLIEFELVTPFHIPLVVDFHVIRVLLELEVMRVDWKKLGPGNPKIRARVRPEQLWEYDSVHIHESLVNQIVAWSYDFLGRHNLSPFDVHNGLWNLSRVLCAAYYGNSCTTIKRADEDGKIHTITERLVDPGKLSDPKNWPKGYRDLCRFCPFERQCGIAIPSGPYYDWGVDVRAGRHVVYPARQPTLMGAPWSELPVTITRRRNNSPMELQAQQEAALPPPEPDPVYQQLTFE